MGPIGHVLLCKNAQADARGRRAQGGLAAEPTPTGATRPVSVESAPYFPALVESSSSAKPIACVARAFSRSLGPSRNLEPMRSAKSAH
jgi:hypothetical protein